MKPHNVTYLRQSDLKYAKNDLKFGKNDLKYCDLKRDFRLGGLDKGGLKSGGGGPHFFATPPPRFNKVEEGSFI